MNIDSCFIHDCSGGGGIDASHSTLSITNSHFLKTNRSVGGGGIEAGACTLSVFATKIDSCRSTESDGGGLWVNGGKVILDSIEVVNNLCSHHGGGIFVKDCPDLKITRSLIDSNKSSLCGGGICFNGPSGTVENCIIRGNRADELGGGGIYMDNASPVIRNCVIEGNSANDLGGGIQTNGAPFIINTRFINNSTGYEGGGIHSGGTEKMTLVNCVFHHNTSGAHGGGLNIDNGSPLIVNNTFYNNIADSGSAVMFINSQASVYNCIFWSNSPAIHPGISNDAYPSFYECDIYGGLGSIKIVGSYPFGGKSLDIINADPLFIDPSNGDFSLKPGSSCINAGRLNPDTLKLPEFDFNGNPRIVESKVDIGACEFQGTTSESNLLPGKGTDKILTPSFSLREDLIRFKSPLPQRTNFHIFDMRGRSCKTITIPAHTIVFRLEGIRPGLWIVQSASTGVSEIFQIMD